MMLIRGAACLFIISTPSFADCKPIVDALAKQATVPTHKFVGSDSVRGHNDAEIIQTATDMYIHVDGRWVQRPYDGATTAQGIDQDFKQKKPDCAVLPSEAFDGQRVERYSTRMAIPGGESSSEFWISAATGLPLKQHSKTPSVEVVIRYDYTGVQPPK